MNLEPLFLEQTQPSGNRAGLLNSHKFLIIVCTDNPYADAWQPSEGTCNKFVELGKN
jgi:hypothetical protein